MFVTEKDLINEKKILSAVKDIPEISQYDWRQSNSKSAIYDFRGYKDEYVAAGLDVKVRSIRVNQYPDYFISKEKAEVVSNHPEYKFYVVYHFERSQVVRVYCLSDIELSQSELVFTHKRSKQLTRNTVYLVAADDYLGEVYLN